MKDPNGTNVASRTLAGLLAACCVYTAGEAQAADVEVRAGTNDRAALHVAQSGDDSLRPAAGADTSTEVDSAAGLDLGDVSKLETSLTGDGSVASETIASVSEAVDTSALDTAIDAAIESEVAGSIDSSVQRDIQAAIESDLVSDIAGSLPLPGSD